MMKKISSFVDYFQQYHESVTNPEGYWAKIADTFQWHKKWDKVLDWNFTEPKIRWFDGGKLNITENIFERNLPERKDQVALIWEPNDPKEPEKKITYGELYEKVCQFANA